MKMMLTEASRRGDEIDLLCEAGAEGWELVAVLPNGLAYLKREVLQNSVTSAEQPLNGAGKANGSQPASNILSEEPASHVRPKYRDPATGDTWSGRGRMASWLKRKLDAGEDREKYLNLAVAAAAHCAQAKSLMPPCSAAAYSLALVPHLGPA
jgi:DNA-binding protein H-NS